ncbi:MAG: Nif3-like dinuclear metal center hexameric protein [Planctomycetota bacterium]
MADVRDVLNVLDALAPFALAAEWDNVGLLAGRPEWPASRALLALDLTDAVAREALENRADLLVLYHPPIFKGLRAVTPDAPGPTTLLPELLAARVALIALHTALDAAAGGTNDVLLDLLRIAQRWPLVPVTRVAPDLKLAVFVPAADVDRLRAALAAAGAGVIGHYQECSFELAGHGTFRGDETTQPTVGRKGVLERVAETRLELVVPRRRLAAVIAALYANHPYEEPAFDVYPREEVVGRGGVGLGRVGVLPRPTPGTELLERLQGRVDLAAALVVGDLERAFRSVTAAAGAFGVEAFRDPDSLVLTGEFKHHDALALLRRGVTTVALGHYASERPVLDMLRALLSERAPELAVQCAQSDRSPLRPALPRV